MSSNLMSSNYVSQVGSFLTQQVESLNLALFRDKTEALLSLAEEPLKAETIELARKVLGFGFSSAAIASSAFYFGYKYAYARTHRFEPNAHNYHIEQIMCKLKLSKVQLNKIMSLLLTEMYRGLDPVTHANADVKMFPTYIRSLPDGTERGDILALDLGGTNFRVLLVNLDSGEIKMKSKVFVIPQSIMTGTGTQLFDHIATCLANFMVSENLFNRPALPLGFTFSFPCKQQGLASATLSTWTKGFDCEGVVGKDVVELLQTAINKRNDIKVNVLALVNDTVGTLMASAYSDHNTRIGLILGTGSNACFTEELANIKTLPNNNNESCEQTMVVNMEWGNLGNNGCLDFIRTSHDYEIDNCSLNPKRQVYEKMMSGLYMGEIVRLIILDLYEKDLLFVGHRDQEWQTDYRQALYTKGSFYTKYVSEIETDSGITFSRTTSVLEQMGIDKPTYDDCAVVKYICKLVSRRAAQLAACGLSVILNHMQKKETTIAVDGSLYRFHPKFKKIMEKTMQILVKPEYKYKMVLSMDGSGKGASLVAAVEERLSLENC
jgi:hexokinase